MTAIYDKTEDGKKFRLAELLAAIRHTLSIGLEEKILIEKIGGVGGNVWEYESTLDEGISLEIPYAALENLVGSANDYLDELSANIRRVYFGISDATFMFVSCEDKNLEERLTLNYSRIAKLSYE